MVARVVSLLVEEGVGAVGLPVKAGLARGAFVAKLSVTVVAKLSSSPKAAANSFSVSKVLGALSTKPLICVFT